MEDYLNKSRLIKGSYLVSHKCHARVSALRFSKHRKWYINNLRITAKEYAVSILNYLVAKDGVYLICEVDDLKTLSEMMQVLQSSASKQFASKRGGESAMWQGRFNATIIKGNTLVRQCMLMLDLHMVATEQVLHPAEWKCSGWQELVGIKKRYKVISTSHSQKILKDNESYRNCREKYIEAIERCCQSNSLGSLETWINPIAIGTSNWIEYVSKTIPDSCKSINSLQCSAFPLDDGSSNNAVLTVSKKRRRGYLDVILRKMGSET